MTTSSKSGLPTANQTAAIELRAFDVVVILDVDKVCLAGGDRTALYGLVGVPMSVIGSHGRRVFLAHDGSVLSTTADNVSVIGGWSTRTLDSVINLMVPNGKETDQSRNQQTT